MGHSQSYDLKNKEAEEKSPVRGVKRVSREHQTDNQFPGEGAENSDYREDELRDRIRNEQLQKRERELETWRVKQHESRDPIIDAYRTPPAQSFTEFNYYDSLKHAHPIDPNTYYAIRPRTEVNSGQVLPLKRVDVPMDPTPPTPKKHPEYPQSTPIFSGRLSPLSRQEEVDPHPMPRYVPPMSEPRYDLPVGTYSKTTTVTTYTHYGNRAPIPKYDEVPVAPDEKVAPQKCQSPQSPQYDQVPTETQVPVRSSPPSSPSVIKFPRAASTAPQYEAVPEETPRNTVTYNIPVSNVPSSKSSPAPHYDEVPEYTVTLPASTNTTYSRKVKRELPDAPYATYSTRGYENIPIYVLPDKKPRTLVIPIRAEKLENLQKAEEVPQVPLSQRSQTKQNVAPVTRTIPVQIEKSSASPRDEKVLSRSSEVTRETLYSTVPRSSAPRSPIVRRKPSIIEATTRKTPTPSQLTPNELIRQTEARGTPLEHYIAHRNRTPSWSSHSTVSTSTSATVLDKQAEVRRTPLEHYVTYCTPTPASVTVSSRTSTPPTVLDKQAEVRRTPLEHYFADRTPTPTPALRSVPVSRSTPPVALDRQTEVRRTPLEHYVVPVASAEVLPKQSEVRRTPLENYVRHSPSPVSDYSNLPVLRSAPYGTRPITPPTMYLERRHSDVEKVSLSRYVAPRPQVPYPNQEREVSGTPLDHHVAFVPYRTYSIPSPQSRRYSSPTPPPSRTPATLYRTQLQPEVRATPVYHYVSKPRYYDSREHVSELHAEKRLIYEIPDDNVTYVKVAEFPTYSATSSPSPRSLEPLYRECEVSRHPIYILPSQTQYEKLPKVLVPVHQHQKSLDKETQYSRRPSEDAVLDYPRFQKPSKTCNVENCTHVEVSDTPVVARRTISEEPAEQENRLTIFVDENEMQNVVDLAKDEDVGPVTSQSRRCFEEKLYYNGYMPTLSLGRRPIVSFYDKLH